ncbi:MAG: hypothetical protein ABSB91_07165, partial [Sedimentisphaerales bacterium]
QRVADAPRNLKDFRDLVLEIPREFLRAFTLIDNPGAFVNHTTTRHLSTTVDACPTWSPRPRRHR